MGASQQRHPPVHLLVNLAKNKLNKARERQAGTVSATSSEMQRYSLEESARAIAEAGALLIWRAAPDGTPLAALADTRQMEAPTVLPFACIALVHPEDQEPMRAKWHRCLAEVSPFDMHYRLRQADGSYRWTRGRGIPLMTDEGGVQEWVGTVGDIHDHVTMEAALGLSEERLRLALESTGLGIWEYDVATGVTWLSETAAQLLQRPGLRLTPKERHAVLHPDDRPALMALFRDAVTRRSEERFETEFRIRRGDPAETIWAACSARLVFRANGTLSRIIGTLGDITERRWQQETLFRLAHYDHLTGLPNRRRLAQLFTEHGARVSRMGFLIVDIDNFKDTNDRFGHAIGDEVLRAVARRLRDVIPDEAPIARLGSDEFGVLLPGMDRSGEVLAMAQQIHEAFACPFPAPERSVHLSAGIGIAFAKERREGMGTLLVEADLAVAEAKRAGQGETAFFAPALRERLHRRQQLFDEFERALDEDEFDLFYQPQVALQDGNIIGAEALLRWRHPERGLLEPKDFLPILAQSRWARPTGDWVLRRACLDAAKLAAQGEPLRVAVNLFSAQLQSGALDRTIERCLAESSLPAHLLEIEITEHVILSNDEATLARLDRITDLGCSLAFDDYGTGYASLSMLTRYPVTRLKIEQSFISSVCVDDTHATIVEAILSLAKSLGLGVTAEGVETSEQAQWLKTHGCPEGQGRLFGMAMPLLDLHGCVLGWPGRQRP